VELGQVHPEQDDHHDRRRDDGRHESALTVEALRLLRGAVRLEGDAQVHRHDERHERERQDQLEPVPHAECAEEEHRRCRVEHDRDDEAVGRVVRK
jgi:hypothetical protein